MQNCWHEVLAAVRFLSDLDLLAVSTLSLFTSSDRYLHRTSTHTRTGRIHLLYTYTWYLYLQGMWAPHTVCTFARCPLLSTDLLRIENKTLDQISISMKTPPCGNHHMYVFMYMCFLCCCKVRVEGYAGTKAQVLKKSQINCTSVVLCTLVLSLSLPLPLFLLSRFKFPTLTPLLPYQYLHRWSRTFSSQPSFSTNHVLFLVPIVPT